MIRACSLRLLVGLCLFLSATPCLAAQASDKSSKDDSGKQWVSLFDGKSLKQWEPAKGIDYERAGKVDVRDGCLVLETGSPATGVRRPEAFPKVNYEIALEARRTAGGDFFCGMSFPVQDGALTLIMGGWGGWVVGLSCLDDILAVDNETCQVIQFENDRWYSIRVRVTKAKVQVWVDGKQKIDLDTKDRKLSVTQEMEPCLPLGFATWYTTGQLRNIRYRALQPAP
jgi:hypothetical protein